MRITLATTIARARAMRMRLLQSYTQNTSSRMPSTLKQRLVLISFDTSISFFFLKPMNSFQMILLAEWMTSSNSWRLIRLSSSLLKTLVWNPNPLALHLMQMRPGCLRYNSLISSAMTSIMNSRMSRLTREQGGTETFFSATKFLPRPMQHRSLTLSLSSSAYLSLLLQIQCKVSMNGLMSLDSSRYNKFSTFRLSFDFASLLSPQSCCHCFTLVPLLGEKGSFSELELWTVSLRSRRGGSLVDGLCIV